MKQFNQLIKGGLRNVLQVIVVNVIAALVAVDVPVG